MLDFAGPRMVMTSVTTVGASLRIPILLTGGGSGHVQVVNVRARDKFVVCRDLFRVRGM